MPRSSLYFEDLAKIGKVFFVFAHVLGRCVGQFGNRLPVAMNHLDDDLQGDVFWRITQIVRQVGANAKSQQAPAFETSVELNGFGDSQAVAEDQRLGQRVNTVVAVVVNQALTPSKGVATVMSSAIKQLAKIQIKVAQKRTHTVDIAERDA